MNAVTVIDDSPITVEWCGGEGYTLYSASTWYKAHPYVGVGRTPEAAISELNKWLSFSRIPLDRCVRELGQTA